MNKKIEQALNAQVEKEMYSSNLYLAMASWAESTGYNGTSKWLYAQAEEERLHMLQFIHYINGRGGKTILTKIDQPPFEWNNVKELFKEVLAHEQIITESINQIVGICSEIRDFSTMNWLQFFVNEQIEEENSVNEILDKLNLLGDSNMYLFDRDVFALRTPAAV